MKHKLKLQLEYFEKAIAVQIQEMDERFRSTLDGGFFEFTSNDGFEIGSENSPHLVNGSLFLRGKNSDRDLEIHTLAFNSNTERDEYVIRMMDALTEWAEKWEGFKDDTLEEKDDSSIYIF